MSLGNGQNIQRLREQHPFTLNLSALPALTPLQHCLLLSQSCYRLRCSNNNSGNEHDDGDEQQEALAPAAQQQQAPLPTPQPPVFGLAGGDAQNNKVNLVQNTLPLCEAQNYALDRTHGLSAYCMSLTWHWHTKKQQT